ncbi:HPr family phosphocarrier protein [Cellulomonas sp. PhB143]|uniref:HPr family phosphocarrier protein n=1 Tax=Cellulomonas sp. PhB143 TaxID=2485186 RepID=UPI000F495310|nr:HPr family phosphocarrier protein [Cellulomonas sp. PhB143]ROS77062.1 phosphocarrier protein [Cellulomonas sp. PhB143]
MKRSVVVAIEEGLHARPAALFVAEAGKQPAPVTIAKGGAEPVAAASILGVMTLGVNAGDEVELAVAEDADEAAAAASLEALEAFLARAAAS